MRSPRPWCRPLRKRMDYLDILHAQLRVDEGVRSHPYTDTAGRLTIGIGRNLTDNGLSRGEIALMYDNDLAVAERAARNLVRSFDSLDDARKAVIVNMAFNMGEATLAQFVNTLKFIEAKDWQQAATAMLSSRWAGQVGARAQRLAQSMRGGI